MGALSCWDGQTGFSACSEVMPEAPPVQLRFANSPQVALQWFSPGQTPRGHRKSNSCWVASKRFPKKEQLGLCWAETSPKPSPSECLTLGWGQRAPGGQWGDKAHWWDRKTLWFMFEPCSVPECWAHRAVRWDGSSSLRPQSLNVCGCCRKSCWCHH